MLPNRRTDIILQAAIQRPCSFARTSLPIAQRELLPTHLMPGQLAVRIGYSKPLFSGPRQILRPARC